MTLLEIRCYSHSLDKEVTLTTDASKETIGGDLTENGYPVIYDLQNLSKSEQKFSNIELAGLAGSGWLEAFPGTDRSTRNVVRCVGTIFCRFGIPYTVISDNGQKLFTQT